MFKSAKFIEWRNAVPSGFPESKPFGVSIPVQRTWQHAKRKCLLVFEHVDTEDLRSGRLLTGPSGTWIKSAIDLGMNYAKHHSPQAPAYAAVNFNFFKTFDLRPEQQIQAATAAAKRIKALAKKLGATDIIVFGDTAASFLMTGSIVKDDNTLLLRRGRPMLHEGVYWTNTISLSLAYQGKSFQSQDDDEDEKESKIDHANLLGYVSRCVGNALIRRHVYKIDVKPRVVTIKTYKGFIRLYRKLMAAPRVSVDAETNSLARVVVKLLTLQFAFDPTKSYLLAIDHKDATWTPEEKKKVIRGLRKFFGREFDPLSTNYDEYLIGQNLKFDLTILRQRLGLYMIQWRVWDLMAGEFCFHPSTLVETNRGRVPISTIMQDQYGYLVKSYNHDTRKTEFKPILLVSTHTPTEKMMELVYEGGTLRATANHKVWSATREEYVEMRDLKAGEDVVVEPPISNC